LFVAAIAAVEFEHVVKDFSTGWVKRKPLRAVNDVSFRIEHGEVFGLLGPNRAGKTTLAKILLSLCHPTGGRAIRLGLPATNRATLASVGYVHDNQAFPRYLTAAGLLEYYGALTLMSEPQVRARAGDLLDFVGLTDRAGEPIARFSKGMVQRLALAQALINDPQLLVLDEPSEGLDIAGRKLIKDVITEQRRRGHTVVLVSHLLADVAELCDRAAVIVGGKLAFLGSIAELAKKAPGSGPVDLEQALNNLYTAAPKVGHS
jgi:ABC-2 type transport system ATP-binding protein